MRPDVLVDGRPYTAWILSLGAIPLLGSGLILAFFAFVVVQWQDRERQLAEMCRIDYLTGVHNRRSLLSGLRESPPEFVALTRSAVERITGREPARDRAPLLPPMRGRYRLLSTLELPVGPVYVFWTEVFLYARADLGVSP